MLPKSIQNLINALNKLPGIGPKSAERLVFHLLRRSDEEVMELGQAVLALKQGIGYCKICFQFSENEICSICDDLTRDHSILCVVENVLDLMALEKVGEYRGIYHVLQGRIDPLRHIGPDQIRIRELKQRLEKDQTIKEVILATDPDIEGETTAMHIVQLFPEPKFKITRIARGLPAGGNLEFADDMTLRNALKGRTNY